MGQMTPTFDRELEERFIRYARIDTQSDESSSTTPSTEKQFDLLRLLVDELREIGAQDVTLTDYGAVLATIPATVAGDAPTVAFLAHVDTSPGFNGTGVEPIVHRGYDGGDIVLPDDPTPGALARAVSLPGRERSATTSSPPAGPPSSAPTTRRASPSSWSWLVTCWSNPDLAHGPIRVCFTPDEEIGRGVHADLPGDLQADVAYTLDGAELGEIVYETFSADKAIVTIQGVSAHPGQAKDVLVNALHLAAKIIDTLPHVTLTPETTSDRQGFIHLYQMSGTRGRGRAPLHPARFRAGRAAGPRRVAAAGLRRRPGHRAARPDHLRDHTPVPQHALLAGRRHAPGRAGAGGLPQVGIEPFSHADPRRHRWLAPDRDGRADAQPLHRHAEHPRSAGMDQRPGHGPRHRDVHCAGAVMGL